MALCQQPSTEPNEESYSLRNMYLSILVGTGVLWLSTVLAMLFLWALSELWRAVAPNPLGLSKKLKIIQSFNQEKGFSGPIGRGHSCSGNIVLCLTDTLYFILLVILMYVSVGMNLVWTSPSLLELKSSLRLETNEEAAILSSFPFGAFLGPITGILLSDRYGYKSLFYMYIGLSIVSLMMLFISSIISICLGRMFSGIAIGALILQLPTYASEIVEEEIISMLDGVKFPAQVLGYVIVYTLGPQLSYNQLLLIYLLIPAATLACQLWMPESPVYQINSGKKEQAKQTVYFLHRGISTSGAEKVVQRIQDKINIQQSNKQDWLTQLSEDTNIKSTVFALIFVSLQQLTGSYLILMTMQTMLFQVTNHSVSLPSVILGLALLVGSVLLPVVTNQYNYKTVILVSSLIMAISMVSLQLFFHGPMGENTIRSSIAVACIMIYLMASLPGAALSEKVFTSFFNNRFKTLGSILTLTVNFFMCFFVSYSFYFLDSVLDNYLCLWIFAIFSTSLAAFVCFYVPQTSND